VPFNDTRYKLRAVRSKIIIDNLTELPFVAVTAFGRVRATQLFLVFFVVVCPIGGRDMTERQLMISLAVTVLFRDVHPTAMMTVRRVTVGGRVVFRRGRSSGRQGSAGG